MKTVTVDQFSKDPLGLLTTAQSERVLVTRNGKPVALLFGLEFKDQEDYALERDDVFWHMIAERRKSNKTIPFDEVKRRLGLPGRSQAKKRSATRTAKKR